MFLRTTLLCFPEALLEIEINENGEKRRIALRETTIVKMAFYKKF